MTLTLASRETLTKIFVSMFRSLGNNAVSRIKCLYFYHSLKKNKGVL